MYAEDEYPNPDFEFMADWWPEPCRRCPKSLVMADKNVLDLLQIHSAVKSFGVLPYAGGLYDQPEELMQLLRVIESEKNRIETAKMEEAKRKTDAL